MSKIIIYHGLKDIIEKTYYHSSKAHNDYGFGFIVLKALSASQRLFFL